MSMHLDEARRTAIECTSQIVENEPSIGAAVVLDDLFGRVSVAFWARGDQQRIASLFAARLQEAVQRYWTGTVLVGTTATPELEQDSLLGVLFRESVSIDASSRVRVNDRHRHHSGWFSDLETRPLWPADESAEIVVFHGFKGGAGRTTLLASYALQQAQKGRKVAVVDMDLDAPGVGTLLTDGQSAKWGTVDFLLEADRHLPLADYMSTFVFGEESAATPIHVVGAGCLNSDFLTKLGRVDLDIRGTAREHAFAKLLVRIRSEIQPDLILIDGRAGLSPSAGLLLSGLAHLHVLVATNNRQNVIGLRRLVSHLGFEQAQRGIPQRECIVVQTQVPEVPSISKVVRAQFATEVEAIFREEYYAQEEDLDNSYWSLSDIDSGIAPHRPLSISYRLPLAHFESIHEILPILVADPEFVEVGRRIDERLAVQ
jgi:cellulose biosynthesis protein BcsQ